MSGTSGTAKYYDLSVTYTQPTNLLLFTGPTMTLTRSKRVLDFDKHLIFNESATNSELRAECRSLAETQAVLSMARCAACPPGHFIL